MLQVTGFSIGSVSYHRIFITFFWLHLKASEYFDHYNNEISHFNSLSPTSDLEIISPYTISTISSRQVMRIILLVGPTPNFPH